MSVVWATVHTKKNPSPSLLHALATMADAAARKFRRVRRPPSSVTGPIPAIPFYKATLCMDCDSVTESRVCCAVCGSTALLGLSAVLSEKKKRFNFQEAKH